MVNSNVRVPVAYLVQESGIRFPEGVNDAALMIKTIQRALDARICRSKYLIFAFGVEYELDGEKISLMIDQDGWAFLDYNDNSWPVREKIIERIGACPDFVNAESARSLDDMDYQDAIRSIPDYPKPGIVFRDITTLLGNPKAFRRAVDAMVEPYVGVRIDKVAGIEARGFILGGAVAHQLSVGFVPVRKKGKLPWKVVGVDYALEYGNDRVEIHEDAVAAGERVLLVDDLIATGGTATAAVHLLRALGARVLAAGFIVDLPDLGGSAKLEALGVRVQTLVSFSGH